MYNTPENTFSLRSTYHQEGRLGTIYLCITLSSIRLLTKGVCVFTTVRQYCSNYKSLVAHIINEGAFKGTFYFNEGKSKMK